MISSFGVWRSARVLNPGDLFAEIPGHITGALTRHRSITKRKQDLQKYTCMFNCKLFCTTLSSDKTVHVPNNLDLKQSMYEMSNGIPKLEKTLT